jgi:hypothetical protein
VTITNKDSFLLLLLLESDENDAMFQVGDSMVAPDAAKDLNVQGINYLG